MLVTQHWRAHVADRAGKVARLGGDTDHCVEPRDLGANGEEDGAARGQATQGLALDPQPQLFAGMDSLDAVAGVTPDRLKQGGIGGNAPIDAGDDALWLQRAEEMPDRPAERWQVLR